VLVDVGGDAEHLLAEVNKRSLKLNAIWLTHGHLDHAGGVPMLLERQNVPVIGPHPDDQFLLDALPETTASYGFPVCPVFAPTRWLHDGDTLSVGQFTFQVLHIPGHTPGQVVFYCAAAKLLLAGDVLFILEAMKMETEVKAAQAGTVRGICVKAGDAVAVGDTVMTLA